MTTSIEQAALVKTTAFQAVANIWNVSWNSVWSRNRMQV